jgi:hypothetical protein
MTPSLAFLARVAAGGAAVLALAVVASCGGGGVVGSGGTGAPVTGYSVGTVNGFGSVIVDGVSYDDLHAPVVVEIAPGQDAPAEVRLGERVSVSYTQAGVASGIRILTALSGPVATAPANGRFTILGQTVLVNGTGGSGPTTQFGGGYLRASDIAAGDPIDVHGVLVLQGATWMLAATRIDKLATAPAYLRVTGVVAGLGAGSTSFVLGTLAVDASAATLLPAASMLSNGEAVTLLALPASYVASGANAPRLRAAQVKVASLQESSIDDFLSGSISTLDTTAKTFLLGAQRVSYGGAVFVPAGAAPSNGSYVQVQGKVGSDGTLVAASVNVRDSENEDESDLSGNIVAFDGVAMSFTLRDVHVDASAATLQTCPAGGLANGLYVQVAGTLASNGVVATTIHCESEPSGGTIERQGRSSAVDTVSRTFTLTPEQGSALTVRWGDTTYFGTGLTPATLSGKTIDVQGSFVGTVLVATKLKLDD